MGLSSWNLIEDLFTEALALDPAERDAFLATACKSNPELIAEIQAMIRAHDENTGLELERWVHDTDTENTAEHNLSGALIGPYRLVKRIGQGGMGEVYLAHRADDQYEQQVALKVVRQGYGSSHLRARFKMERQILARLTHPHITQLLSGGVDDSGRLYLVMPYVEGVPITTYCDAKSLSVDQRLVLFQTVCDAVQYAHSNLVVHRDLKPSNILVTEQGQVQLLDFGIAKLLNQDEGNQTAITQSEMRPMTPEYAAPEQVKGEPITTATDIYALGCLLFELLSGQRPFNFHGKSLSEIEQLICEHPPIRPSSAVSGEQHETKTGITRDIDPRRLKKMLRGDLDNIVLKALRKEPGRRYHSSSHLSEDIDRYRKGMPVAAQRDSVSYRMRKFVGRHRVPVLLSSLLAISLIGFSIFTLYQGQLVEQERDTALLQKNRAERVIGLLVQLFETANPAIVPGGDTLRVGEFVDRGVEKTLTEVEGDTVLTIQLMQTLGRMYSAKGQYRESHDLLHEAYMMQEASVGPYDSTTTALLDEYAVLTWRMGNADTARVMFDELLQRNIQIFGSEHPRVAKSLANVSLTTQDHEEKRSLLESSLAMRRKLLPANHMEIAQNLNQLAIYHHRRGVHAKAIQLYQETLDILEDQLSLAHPNILTVMGNLSASLSSSGDLEKAISIQQEVLSRLNQIAPDTSVQVANAWNNLAVLKNQSGNLTDAESGFRHALELQKALLGENHYRVISTMRNLALNLDSQERFDEALALFEQVLALNEPLKSEERFGSLANYHSQYAFVLHNAGRLGDATQEIELALRLLHNDPDTPPSYQSSIYLIAGLIYMDSERLTEARELAEKGLTIREELYSADHPIVAQAKCIYGRSLALLGEEDEALRMIEAGLDIYASWPQAYRRQVEAARQVREQLLSSQQNQ